MRVKILKANDSEYWYSNQIGKVFEVNEELENDYRLYDANGFGMTIAKDDCELYRGGLSDPDGGDYPLKWMSQKDKV
jgi:hypothetical protein